MTPGRARLIARCGQWLLRALIATLRFRVEDRAGVTRQPGGAPVLWAFWHNRLLIVPYLFEHFTRGRPSAALTSASKDGELVAALLACFGVGSIRGSSSRRGALAWRELRRAVAAGLYVGITPDGPRGPRYEVQPGLLLLAQKTGTPVMPVRIRYSRAFELKSWDRFQIPLPFARVDVLFDEPVVFAPTDTESAFEVERSRLELFLREGLEEFTERSSKDALPSEERAPHQ